MHGLTWICIYHRSATNILRRLISYFIQPRLKFIVSISDFLQDTDEVFRNFFSLALDQV